MKTWNNTDKSDWIDGEWKNEPDKCQWIDEETGFDCKEVTRLAKQLAETE